jgi:16S rRNA (guanine966-N2)-methyltransferase
MVKSEGQRILGGEWRNRRLVSPPGDLARPLLARQRKSLFDWLGDLEGQTVIDICAGAGSFGLEAASRGATVHLIEADRLVAHSLQTSIKTFGGEKRCILHEGRFETVLPKLSEADLVWADPPFPWASESPETLALLVELMQKSLRPGGLLLIRLEAPHVPPGGPWTQARAWGRSVVYSLNPCANAKQ